MPHYSRNSVIEDKIELLSIPYAQRQLIVVVDDYVIEHERKIKQELIASGGGITWIKLSTMLVTNPPYVLASITAEAIKALNRLRDQGINVLTIGQSEAAALCFLPGHPRDGVLYIGHPAEPSVYYTAAQFHRLTFEHKFAEATHLLMCLGATSMQVECVAGWSREFSVHTDLSPSLSAEQVGASVDHGYHHESNILFSARLKGNAHPCLPERQVWYPHEPTWHEIVEGRLRWGLEDFSLSVRYEDDFGVNAGLRLAVTKAGLDLGGRFEDHQSTVWHISGKFRDWSPLEEASQNR